MIFNISTFLLIVLIVVAIGSVVLQIFLSKTESRIPGLVLPIIAFLMGLIYPVNMVAPYGEISAGLIILVWLLGNIPTFVFIAIYIACREKQRRSRQINRMNIQDLQ